MKKITVLGSTGSIGTQSLEVIKAHPDRFRVEALTCGKNKKKLEEQIEKFRPAFAVTEREEDAHDLMRKFPRTEFSWGEKGLIEAAEGGCDMVLNALMGMRGLAPTYAAIQAGKDIALANKETLVAGGELVMDAAAKAGVKLLPVDSEHSAIFQCLETRKGKAKIKRLLLTASGGPFFGKTAEELKDITPEKALAHPTWKMGKKITIDSATLMNKGLEIIEAVRLFGVDESKVKVVIHRESIVHSAVEFEDNAIIAQLGLPDMRVPIQYAITYPDRKPSPAAELDLASLAKMTFYEPDEKTFRSLSLARQAIRTGGTAPTVFNAANEVAVARFLSGEIGFLQIADVAERALNDTPIIQNPDIEDIFETDRKVRQGCL